jgi:hypothetical protein
MTNSDLSGQIPTGKYRSITVKSGGQVRTFTGEPELQMLFITGTYFISLPDNSVPSGRKVVWQQRVENGVAEGVEITGELLG